MTETNKVELVNLILTSSGGLDCTILLGTKGATEELPKQSGLRECF